MQTKAVIKILGIEVVQSIQNLGHTIPLLAYKQTMVRVYVRPTHLGVDMPITGTLELRRGEEEEASEIRSESVFQLRSLDIGDDDRSYLDRQRRFVDRSLNFRLGPDQIREGAVRLRLKQVAPTLHGDPGVSFQEVEVEVHFERGPVLRVRAVGLRVRDPRTGTLHAPKQSHFKALRSFLERAFPVSSIDWSEITVAAATGFEPPYSGGQTSIANPGPVWQKKFDIACAHLMAIRAQDVDSGLDPRTHYYGMVYHPNDFFVGAVSNVPDSPRPDIIGIGPAEFEDGSYGAHELAHTLGRLHPGFCEGQSAEDTDFPASYRGRLSDSHEDDQHHGFDIGDSIDQPRVLPFDEYYDLMTYCHPLWVSAYSYKGMLQRLREEEKVVPEKGEYLQVIGLYDLEKIEGALSYVFPVHTRSLAIGTEEQVVVAGMDAAGKQLFKEKVELKRTAAIDLTQNSGAFQITVPNLNKLRKLELRVADVPVASHHWNADA
jgi:hypothetical protein